MSWHDDLMQKLDPDLASLFIVTDSVGLLREERVYLELDRRGFVVLSAEDPVALRYSYEREYRNRRDNGEDVCAIVLSQDNRDSDGLPVDIVEGGVQVVVRLSDYFPDLAQSVVAALDFSMLDRLHEILLHRQTEPLGENATKDLLLNDLYGINPVSIRDVPGLLKMLLDRHYRRVALPAVLDERLIELLRSGRRFSGWPLPRIVPDETAFLEFLQERWRVYVESHLDDGTEAHDPKLDYGGPSILPFERLEIRVYLDNLFAEGRLRKVDLPPGKELKHEWMGVGIAREAEQAQLDRLPKLQVIVEDKLPPSDAGHHTWMDYAQVWGEYQAVYYDLAPKEQKRYSETHRRLCKEVDDRFATWLFERFGALNSLPPVPPVMVNHVGHMLSRHLLEHPQSRVAIVILDGMAWQQWAMVRDCLRRELPGRWLDERSVFAWIPSLTCISRQSIWAAAAPLFFPTSIESTSSEESLWRRYWEDKGLRKSQVSLVKGQASTSLVKDFAGSIDDRVKVLGVVLDKIDKIVHGAPLGMSGVQKQVELWLQGGELIKLLRALADAGYTVWITSDHGNVEGTGCGVPKEGVLANTAGKRARVYSSATLRDENTIDGCIAWNGVGLPDGMYPLLPPHRQLFVPEGEVAVSHGGISLEEILVPLIRIVDE